LILKKEITALWHEINTQFQLDLLGERIYHSVQKGSIQFWKLLRMAILYYSAYKNYRGEGYEEIC
jgi:hypothetical protein